MGFISADVHREHLGEEAEADTSIAQEVSHWHGDEELKEEVKATSPTRSSRRSRRGNKDEDGEVDEE